jgi:hypothetical protein
VQRSGPVAQGSATGGPGVIVAVIAVLVLGAAGVAAFAAFSVETDAPDVVVIDQVGAPSPSDDGGTTPVGADDAEELDLLRRSLRPLLDALEPELGSTFRVRGLTVYPEYALLDVEPPELPGELDRWVVYPPTRVMGPDPVTNPGDVEAQLFPITDLDLAVLAALPDRAEEALADDIPGGEAGYFVIDRSSSDGDVVAITVYVRSERRNGYVRFSTTGEVLRVYGG